MTTSQALTTSFPSLSSIEFEWKYQHPLQLPNFIFLGKVWSTLRRRERPLWCPNTRERESLKVMGRIICSSGQVRAREKVQKHSGLVTESRKWKKVVASAFSCYVWKQLKEQQMHSLAKQGPITTPKYKLVLSLAAACPPSR